jgi:hypothetical protein
MSLYDLLWWELPETASLIEAKFSRLMTHNMILSFTTASSYSTVEQNAVV